MNNRENPRATQEALSSRVNRETFLASVYGLASSAGFFLGVNLIEQGAVENDDINIYMGVFGVIVGITYARMFVEMVQKLNATIDAMSEFKKANSPLSQWELARQKTKADPLSKYPMGIYSMAGDFLNQTGEFSKK